MTESNVFELSALCRFASPCASQAIEFVLPEPAECWIKYLCPGPSFRVALSRLVTASHWWKRGKIICLLRERVPVIGSTFSVICRFTNLSRICSQLSRCSTRSHRYEVAAPFGLTGLPAPPLLPRLNGKNTVLAPSSLVVICTSLVEIAKCTNARAPNLSSGSPWGRRSLRY